MLQTLPLIVRACHCAHTKGSLGGTTNRTIQGKGRWIDIAPTPRTIETWTDRRSCRNGTIIASILHRHLASLLCKDRIPSLGDLLITRESKGQSPAIDRRRSRVRNG